MPTYEYYCEQCDSTFEKAQKFSDAPLTVCPEGHEGVRKVYSAAGIIFKGSGWYIKDKNASNGSSSVNGSKSAGSGKSSEPKANESDATKANESDATKTSETKTGESEAA